jgi:hypothetical protein
VPFNRNVGPEFCVIETEHRALGVASWNSLVCAFADSLILLSVTVVSEFSVARSTSLAMVGMVGRSGTLRMYCSSISFMTATRSRNQALRVPSTPNLRFMSAG